MEDTTVYAPFGRLLKVHQNPVEGTYSGWYQGDESFDLDLGVNYLPNKTKKQQGHIPSGEPVPAEAFLFSNRFISSELDTTEDPYTTEIVQEYGEKGNRLVFGAFPKKDTWQFIPKGTFAEPDFIFLDGYKNFLKDVKLSEIYDRRTIREVQGAFKLTKIYVNYCTNVEDWRTIGLGECIRVFNFRDDSISRFGDNASDFVSADNGYWDGGDWRERYLVEESVPSIVGFGFEKSDDPNINRVIPARVQSNNPDPWADPVYGIHYPRLVYTHNSRFDKTIAIGNNLFIEKEDI